MIRAIAALLMLSLTVLHGGCTGADRRTEKQEFTRKLPRQPVGRQVAVGDFLIFRGVLRGCSAWVGRPLAAPEIPADGKVTLFGTVSVEVLGRWPEDIRDSIVKLHDDDFPHLPPPRLTVEVIEAANFAAIAEEVVHSLMSLYQDSCPKNFPPAPIWWRDVERYQPKGLPPSDDLGPLFERLG
jgi:hypothetical protein